MAAKLGLFLFADPTPPPVEPAPSTYVPEPTVPKMPATHDHGHRPAGQCPVDALKLRVCASVLGGFIKISLPEYHDKCCPLVYGLVDINAAACLCTALNIKVLDTSLQVPIGISFLLNQCNKNFPPDFTCPCY
ncbi:Cortical cell-delineating protein [Dichanthelium oligosanthes]|uniref:Cortical cell-delineating protein n=1 Tax=Dichanthelium oligosanthes TaxID=888268 RepID=A0A1E5V9U4_9POAL|nr:Cortical cell-delineating protein [Dichanthelium oligosanthes]